MSARTTPTSPSTATYDEGAQVSTTPGPADRPARRPADPPADQAARILAALGGVANIVEIEPCTTRLRSEVRDAGQVDVPGLRAAGAHGVMMSGRVVQVVVGPSVDVLASDLEDLM